MALGKEEGGGGGEEIARARVKSVHLPVHEGISNLSSLTIFDLVCVLALICRVFLLFVHFYLDTLS